MSDVIAGTVELVEGMRFLATAGSGHSLELDTAAEHGGTDLGPRPLELVLLALGGCTGMDVVSILRKMRQRVTDYRIRLRADRADDHPRVLTRIEVEHIITGVDISVDAVRRAVELSEKRYCSVGAMLGKAAPIEVRFRVVDSARGKEVSGSLVDAAAN